MAGTHSQAHLDVLARQMGFHDYETYVGYQRHQEMLKTGVNGVPGEAGAPTQPAGNNWLQNALARIPIHPSYLLGKVNDAFTRAGQ